MTKQEVNLLKKARKNCLNNVECLLWGSDSSYPTFEDIKKAMELYEFANILHDKIEEVAGE